MSRHLVVSCSRVLSDEGRKRLGEGRCSFEGRSRRDEDRHGNASLRGLCRLRLTGSTATLLAMISSGLVIGGRDLTDGTQGADSVAEYCGFEKFAARCPTDEIILIRRALYGRMQAGRCVTAEYGHAIGCYTDVTSHVSGLCSGRQNCSILVATMDSVAQPCAKDFKSYLEASYRCVKVSFTDDCRESNVTSLTDHIGYLALYPRSTWRGDHDVTTGRACHWLLDFEPGRRVTLSWARRFSPGSTSGGSAGISGSFIITEDDHRSGPVYSCPVQLRLRELTSSGSTGEPSELSLSACYSQNKYGVSSSSHVPLYESQGHRLEVYVTFEKTAMPASWIKDSWKLQVLQYTVHGCADPESPLAGEGATVLRHPDSATVICNRTGDTWYLTCIDGRWTGDVGNCTNNIASPNMLAATTSAMMANSSIDIKNGAMLAVLVGVAVGMLLGSLMLFVIVLIKRSYVRSGDAGREYCMGGGGGRGGAGGGAGGELHPPIYGSTTTEHNHFINDYHKQQQRQLLNHTTTTLTAMTPEPDFLRHESNGADYMKTNALIMPEFFVYSTTHESTKSDHITHDSITTDSGGAFQLSATTPDCTVVSGSNRRHGDVIAPLPSNGSVVDIHSVDSAETKPCAAADVVDVRGNRGLGGSSYRSYDSASHQRSCPSSHQRLASNPESDRAAANSNERRESTAVYATTSRRAMAGINKHGGTSAQLRCESVSLPQRSAIDQVADHQYNGVDSIVERAEEALSYGLANSDISVDCGDSDISMKTSVCFVGTPSGGDSGISAGGTLPRRTGGRCTRRGNHGAPERGGRGNGTERCGGWVFGGQQQCYCVLDAPQQLL